MTVFGTPTSSSIWCRCARHQRGPLSGSMPGNERRRKHPLGRGRAVGVRLPQAAEANLGARPADPDSTASNVCAALVADTSVTSDQMDRPGQVIETYGTEDTDPQRHPVWSAAA